MKIRQNCYPVEYLYKHRSENHHEIIKKKLKLSKMKKKKANEIQITLIYVELQHVCTLDVILSVRMWLYTSCIQTVYIFFSPNPECCWQIRELNENVEFWFAFCLFTYASHLFAYETLPIVQSVCSNIILIVIHVVWHDSVATI